MIVGHLKRCLAGFLAMAIVLTSSNIAYALEKMPSGEEETYSKNAAAIVADYYNLEGAQKEILKNSQIAGGEKYVVTAPEVNAENDIDYDYENQTVYVKQTTSNGWKAESADLLVTENGESVSKAQVLLENSSREGWDLQGTFNVTELDSYEVSVNYVYYENIEKAEQERILAIPENLIDGIQNLEDLLAIQVQLNELKGQLESIINNKNILFNVGVGENYISRVESAHKALFVDNQDSAKTLAQWIFEYNNAESQVEFLINYGADVYAAVVFTYEQLSQIYTESDVTSLEAVYESMSNMDTLQLVASAMRSYIDTLEALVDAEAGKLTNAEEVEWKILNESAFHSGYSVEESFENAVMALYNGNEDLTEVSVAGDIEAPVVKYTQSVDVNTSKVYVTVQIKVADTTSANTGKVSTIKALDRYELKLSETSAADEVKKQISNVVANANLSEQWKAYDFNVDGIYSSVETGLENIGEEGWTLTEDIEYVLTYNPVTYTVKQDFMELSKELVHGSVIHLESSSNAETVYEYTVTFPTVSGPNVEYYEQGTTFDVKADMEITRTLAEAKESVSLWSVLADEEEYDFSSGEKSILKSTALNSPIVKIRYPGEVNVPITAEADGTHWVTADAKNAGVAGMTWIPETVKLYNADNTQVGDPIPFAPKSTRAAKDVTNYLASWNGNGVSYKTAEICYKLHLTKVSEGTGYRDFNFAELEAGVNLPYVLVEEVQEQNRILTGTSGVTARTIYENLKNDEGKCKLNGTVLATLKSSLDVNGDSYKAVADIQSNCMNAEGELVIFDYLRSCAETATVENGDWNLASIYRNGYYEKIRTEAEKLQGSIKTLAESDELDKVFDLVEPILGKEAVDELRDYFKSETPGKAGLSEQFEELASSIHDPHEYLNVEHSDLDVLIKTIVETNPSDTRRRMPLEELYAYCAESVAAPSTVVYTVVVKVDGNTPVEAKYTVDLEGATSKVFSQDDFKTISDMITEAEEQLGLVQGETSYKQYYNVTSNLDEFEVGVTSVSGARKITVSYVPKTYTVIIEGEKAQSFQYGKSQEIVLPECMETDEAGNRPYYYKYNIKGIEKTVLNTADGLGTPYTFTDLGMFDSEVKEPTITITRTKVEKKWDDVDSFITTMNKALSDKGLDNLVKFAGVKSANEKASNAKYDSIVMKINATTEVETSAVMGVVATAFESLNYNYIGFKGSEDAEAINFKYYDENNDMKLNPQGLVELILTSGTSTATILEAIDENGNPTNNVPLNDGYVTVDGKESDIALGGTVVKSNILLGTDLSKSYSIPMYITLGGDDTGYLVQIRNLMSSLTKYMAFTLDDNKVSFVGAVPENIYNVYLSFMILMNNNISLDSINDADLETQLKEIMKMMEPVLVSEEFDWEVVVKTLNELGIDTKDIENQKDIITKLVNASKKLYRKYKGLGDDKDPIFEKSEQSYVEFTVSYDAGAVLKDVEGFGLIEGMLASTNLEIPFKFELVNIKEAYEALVIDNGKDGLAKISYTEDLATTLAEADGFTYVVLLKDIENIGGTTKVLDINNTTILNLNGHIIHANINAEDGNVKIVNSTMDTKAPAAVWGVISGNATLMSGYYFEKNIDKDNMVNSSYEAISENGMIAIHNKYYTLEEDAEGNVTVVLTTKFADAIRENVKDVAVEIATDLLFRTYTNASVAVVDGTTTYGIYDIEFANLLKYLSDYSAAASDALAGIDKTGISGFVNALIQKFTDFDAIADVLESEDLTIAAYDLETSKWYAKVNVDSGKLAMSILSGKNNNDVDTTKLTFKFAENNEELAASFRELEELKGLVTINPKFELNNITYSVEEGFKFDGYVGADVVVDMLGENGQVSDYVTTLAIILAYNMPEGQEKTDFIQAIKNYDLYDYRGDLIAGFDNVKAKELKAAFEKAKTVEFKEMVETLGLSETEAGDYSEALVNSYKPLLDAFSEVYTEIENVVGKENIDALFERLGDRTLGGTKDDNNHYVMNFANDSNSVDIRVTLKLFGTMTKPEDPEDPEDPENPENPDEPTYKDDVQKFKDLFAEIPAYPGGKKSDIKDTASESVDLIKKALEAYETLTDAQKKIVEKEYAALRALIEKYEAALGVWAEDVEGTYVYNGSEHKPEVKVYFGVTELVKDKDYTVAYKYTTNAAKAASSKAPQVILTLKGNYSGKIHKYFTIEKINLSKGAKYLEDIGLEIGVVYQSASKKGYAQPTITLNGKVVDASNFKFTYPSGDAYNKLGVYTATITGNSQNFEGSTSIELNVVTALLKDVTVEKKIQAQKYKTGGVKPGSSMFKLTYNGTTLVEGKHFEIVGYSNYDKAGTASVTLRGLGLEHKDEKGLCFGGTLTLNYKIKAIGSLKKVSLKTTKKTYTGDALKLSGYTVKGSKGKKLVEGRDYTVSYENNVNAGKATIIFTGIGGYKGTISKTFTVAKKSLSSKYLTSGKNLKVKYTKGGATPIESIELTYKRKVLEYGKDYTIKWSNNTKVKKATAKKSAPYFTITGVGNFKGSFKQKFTITGTSLKDTQITVNDVAYKNKKNNFKPVITILDTNGKKLKSGTDYTVSYQVLKDGKWKSVSKSKLYKSKRLKLSAKNYEEQLRAVIKGKGSYGSDKIYKEYRMSYRDINKAKINVSDYTYSRHTAELRQIIEKNLKVYYGKNLLKAGTDYDYEIVSINNYENAGEATINITGVNVYSGSVTKTFTIKTVKYVPTQIKKGMLASTSKNLVVEYVKGTSSKPSTSDIKLSYVNEDGVKEDLIYGRDYTIKYYNAKKVAKSTAKKAPKYKIVGAGNFSGSFTVKYTIKKSSVADLEVSAKNKVYKDRAENYKTKVTVKDVNGQKLVAGKDYSVSYQVKQGKKWVSVTKAKLYNKSAKKLVLKNNKKSVEMRVVIKGKGNYNGKITDTYTLKK